MAKYSMPLDTCQPIANIDLRVILVLPQWPRNAESHTRVYKYCTVRKVAGENVSKMMPTWVKLAMIWSNIGGLVVGSVVWRSCLFKVVFEAAFRGQLNYHIKRRPSAWSDTSTQQTDDVFVLSNLLHGGHFLHEVFQL